MPKKRILFIHYVPNRGGAATSMVTLIRHLDPKRYHAEVLMACQPIEPITGDLRELGIPVHHLPVPLIWDRGWWAVGNRASAITRKAFSSFAPLTDFLRKNKPDIVHINDFVPTSAAYSACDAGIPVVWHCRSVIRHCLPLIDPGKQIIEVMNQLSNIIIAISETEAEQYTKEKTHVVYNPLEFMQIDRALEKSRLDIRRALGLEKDDFVVTAPVPLSKNKGAWDFIRAAGLVKKNNSGRKVKFIFVGLDGGLGGRRHLLRKWTGCLGPQTPRQYAEGLLRRCGIEQETRILGFRKNVYEIMHASDLIVFPSRLKACGRACFEAGALRKPVIVTMPTKNTGVVLDEKTGLILPDARPDLLACGIERFINDPELCQKMGDAGYAHVRKNFDPDVYANRIMSLYDSVLGGAGDANSRPTCGGGTSYELASL